MSRQHKKLDKKRWERVRREVLDAATWRCSECSAYGNQVHHRLSLERGGAPYDIDNLDVLCQRCHILATYREKDNQVSGKTEWIGFLAEMTRK